MAKPLIRITLAGVAFTIAAACAPAAGPGATYTTQGGRQCFAPREVQNFRGAENGVIYVRVRISEVFELTAQGCAGTNFSRSGVLRPDGTSQQLCIGDGARLRAGGSGTLPTTCAVRVARKLTPEEVAALPDSAQP